MHALCCFYIETLCRYPLNYITWPRASIEVKGQISISENYLRSLKGKLLDVVSQYFENGLNLKVANSVYLKVNYSESSYKCLYYKHLILRKGGSLSYIIYLLLL